MDFESLDIILGCIEVDIELEKIIQNNVFLAIIPELGAQVGYNQLSPFHDFTLWEHTKKVVSNVPDNMLDLRWVGLFHDIGKPFTQVIDSNGVAHYHGHNLVGAHIFSEIATKLNLPCERSEYIYEQVAIHLSKKSDIFIYDNISKKV